MAVVRCPNCGKENPDSLSACQFCQAPLSSGSTMKIGDKPTKKNTGELEPVLPDWLRDMRQQARESAEKDAADAASMPKVQPEGPPDLLAGLASQSSKADEDEVPAWLTGLSPKKEAKPASSAPPTETASDFFAQFEQPVSSVKGAPEAPQPPASTNAAAGQSSAPTDQDELSEWFTKASEEPSEPFSFEPGSSGQELNWDLNEGASTPAQKAQDSPQEDLSWLRNLEAEARKTGGLSQPEREDGRPSASGLSADAGASSQDDLSWLDSLGGQPAEQPGQERSDKDDDLSWLNAFDETPQASPPPVTPPASQADFSWLQNMGALPPTDGPAKETPRPAEDLSWLSAFGETPPAPQEKEISPTSKDDLSWLDELGGASQPAPLEQEKPAPADDLSWLRDLEETPGSFSGALTDSTLEQNQPAAEEDLSWLRDLQGTPGSVSGALSDSALEQNQRAGTGEMDNMPHVSPFTPRKTAPLDDYAEPELPDWLKSATEEPSMPLGPEALNRMREDRKPPASPDDNISRALFGAVMLSKEEQPASPAPETPPVEPVPPSKEAAPLFNEVSSLFSDDLPDWLSGAEPETSQTVEEIGIHAEGGEALSPAELPSWVQAMRPVEAVIAAGAVAGVDNLPAEREGPLAGLKGVIPAVAFGALRRPRPIPLTLQTTEDQQSSAAILEGILAGETTPRPASSAPAVTSQQTLRWIIAGLLLFVLAAVLFSGTQIMPISPVLPPEAREMTNVVMGIADNAPVLVIMDYQPGLAGEMEAVSGPLLDQLVRLHNPYLTFVATSPSGNALVERLLANTNISQPGGVGYVTGQNYTDLGYLPGGEAGVLAFLQSPQAAIPSSPVLSFSEYAAILLLTDHADSARTWVEQISIMKQADPTLASQPLLTAASAQTGPMLQPYFSSGQITGMVSGLSTAASYESLNDSRPGMARTYWDAFGVGMMMAVFLIVLGSLWSVYSGIRASRVKAAEE